MAEMQENTEIIFENRVFGILVFRNDSVKSTKGRIMNDSETMKRYTKMI